MLASFVLWPDGNRRHVCPWRISPWLAVTVSYVLSMLVGYSTVVVAGNFDTHLSYLLSNMSSRELCYGR